MTSGERYRGPLFLVGMPRSGTKLLRALTGQHTAVRLTTIETAFLPDWVRRWGPSESCTDKESFGKFYRQALRYRYFEYMRERGMLIPEVVWRDTCPDYSLASVFEALVRHDVGAPHGSELIWGDKSPNYLTHMALIKEMFPAAKFVHIIRDVRDYCLSIQQAWRKNVIRAAQRWVDDLSLAKRQAAEFPHDYMEVRFEDLVDHPERQMQRFCSFLDLQYEPEMIKLSAPTENLGDARRQVNILSSNTEKYVARMHHRTRVKIEAIAGDLLDQLGYPVPESHGIYNVRGFEMRLYQLMDGYNILRFRLSNKQRLGSFRSLVRKLLN